MKIKNKLLLLLASNLIVLTACEEPFSYEERPYSYSQYVEEGANQEFEDYLNEFFADYLADDYLAWNIFTIKGKNFGMNREEYGEPAWYTYESYTKQDLADDYEELKGYYDILKAFDTNTLTENQMVSYDLLDEFFKAELEFANPENGYDPMMRLDYIDQFGGYAANFPQYMESYSFWDEDAIKDALAYIKSLPDAFNSYLTYCDDKAAAGYPISDFTLDEQISYLNDSIDLDEGEQYYLIDVLKNKMDAVYFLPQKKIDEYKAQFESYINDYMIPAFSSLAEGLETKKGKCTKEGYLASYGDAGKKQYVFTLRNRLGDYDLDVDAYGAYLKDKIEYYVGKMNSTISLINSFEGKMSQTFNKYYNSGSSVVSLSTPEEMMPFLKEFSKTLVPDLNQEPEIKFKNMDDASAEVSNAVAYYMKSAIDNTSEEYITLNPKKLGSDLNDTLDTIAHEGYPGHMYAYMYTKELPISNIAKIMTNTSHGEGWATYIQYKLYDYLKKKTTCPDATKAAAKTYIDYCKWNHCLGYPLYAYIDWAVHYKAWTIPEIKALMDGYGFNGDAAQDIYRTVIECPADYSSYGYGLLHFIDLHDNAKTELGDKYDEIEFNTVILSQGWVGFDRLDKLVNNYITKKKA